MNNIETYKYKGLTIEIDQDESPENPRKEYDNAGKLVIYSNGNFMESNELDMTFRMDDYANWDELGENVLLCYPKAALLPVYRYEHSCVVYNTTGFGGTQHAEWDSCRVGFILCTYETMLKEWGKKIVTQKVRERACKYIAGEVETYSQWANGEVYCFSVTDEHGEDLPDDYDGISSCGMYGIDYTKERAEEAVDSILPKWQSEAVSRASAALNDALEAAGQQRLNLG